MRGLKTSRIMYVIGLFLLLYTFSSIDTHAYEYKIGISRVVAGPTDPKIVGVGGQAYDLPYFTGVGYCTGYYYLNHKKNTLTNPIVLSRQVLQYSSGATSMFLDYLNFKTGGATNQWNNGGIVGPTTYLGNYIYIYNLSPIDGNSNRIPYTYTLGRFGFINRTNISQTTISGYYLSTPANNESTYINHANNTNFYTDADTGYSVDILYYAQPCMPDTPIVAGYTAPINGNADGAYTLATVPAFQGRATNTNAGRPRTVGSTDFTTSNFIPGSLNVGMFNHHISFDSGIYLAGIKEPDISSSPGESFTQAYYYNAGSARYSGFSFVDNNYVPSVTDTSNQRGINPSTINVTLTFVGVDKTNYSDAGTSCTIIISGDTNLGLSGLGYSWNRNQLGYSVNIASGTIRNLAKQQCAIAFSSIATGNIDLKREIGATIKWDAWDYANSMIISQTSNAESYTPANQITNATGYSFNSYSGNPILSMATDTLGLINATYVYNVPITNQNLFFTGTDVYAGINSGTFVVVVSGYTSSLTKSNTRRTSGITQYAYTFSGNDITKTPFNLHNERYDYAGLVDFATKVGATTGTHFTVSLKATDFVGNTTTQNYIFETPTWPNPPKGTHAPITSQSNNAISQITIINDITQDTIADGGGSQYNYTGYYPSSSALINNFSYISGGTYLNTNTNMVLTAMNGNAGSTVVTLTGLTFNYNGSGSYITGTPRISSGGQAMLDYVATNFTFQVLATNIYGITGVITYTINVAPSCTESAGCTDPVYVFRGTTLSGAMAQQTAALLSGEAYLKANHRYPHWFAEIKQTGPNFYFTGDGSTETLYCASIGNNLLINYGGYTGPQGTLGNSPLAANFTGTTLNISGGIIFQFGVFTASVSADYVTALDNGQQKMTVYVNRPLTGKSFYSVCEFTGATLDVFGCPVVAGHNRTGDINWKKLNTGETFTMTGWVEGGWMTGNWNGYVTGGSINNGDQFNFWSTGLVYDGGGYRLYSKTLSGDVQQNINTSGEVLFTAENRTASTTTFGYEIYWIDNTPPQVTGAVISTQPNQSVTFQLNGSNTGQLANSQVSNLIGDDEYIITSFSGVTAPQLFEAAYGSPIHTGSRYVNGSGSVYGMTHTMTFASDRAGYICTQDRAGNQSCIFVNVTGVGNLTDLTITIRPAFRQDPSTSSTGYSIESGDFWFWVLSGTEWIQNYNSAINTLTNPKVTTNKYGTGTVSITTPATGSTYLVVFKGPGTLSAGFTGIWDASITEMNFFTGTYAENFSSDFVYKFSSGSVLEHYLKPGDIIANSTGDYDYIGTTDFSQINNYLTIGTNAIPFHRYDFDTNSVISSMEQSMILQARNSHGFIGWLESNSIIPMTGFVSL